MCEWIMSLILPHKDCKSRHEASQSQQKQVDPSNCKILTCHGVWAFFISIVPTGSIRFRVKSLYKLLIYPSGFSFLENWRLNPPKHFLHWNYLFYHYSWVIKLLVSMWCLWYSIEIYVIVNLINYLAKELFNFVEPEA